MQPDLLNRLAEPEDDGAGTLSVPKTPVNFTPD